MSNIKLDYSECPVEAIPEFISIKLPNGVTMKFSVHKMTAMAPATAPATAPTQVKHLCRHGFRCTYKGCKFVHRSWDEHKKAFLRKSPTETHEAIEELFEKLPKEHLQILVNCKSTTGFNPFQKDCNDKDDCDDKYCAFIHPVDEQKHFKDISTEHFGAIKDMVYDRSL